MLTEEQRQDAERLKILFEKYKGDHTQSTFGRAYGIGNASMVSQYINGKRPLNFEAARKFVIGLGIPLAHISPTLAIKTQSVSTPNNTMPNSIPMLASEPLPPPTQHQNPLTMATALKFLADELMHLDSTARRRAGMLLSDLAEDPAQHESLCNVLKTVITTGKRRAA